MTYSYNFWAKSRSTRPLIDRYWELLRDELTQESIDIRDIKGKNRIISHAILCLCFNFLRQNKKCHKHVTNAPKGIGLAQDTFEER